MGKLTESEKKLISAAIQVQIDDKKAKAKRDGIACAIFAAISVTITALFFNGVFDSLDPQLRGFISKFGAACGGSSVVTGMWGLDHLDEYKFKKQCLERIMKE